jgi:hypothetical protein
MGSYTVMYCIKANMTPQSAKSPCATSGASVGEGNAAMRLYIGRRTKGQSANYVKSRAWDSAHCTVTHGKGRYHA